MLNNSPWLYQLDKKRKTKALSSDKSADIAVVGGGIAGVSTAFFILKNTDASVVLLEAGKLAHGATGHNAGQITSYFEKPFHDLVREFGIEMAAEGQKAIENAWMLLDRMYTEAGLDIPFSRFKGHLGLSSKDHVLSFLQSNRLRKNAGLIPEEIRISEHADFIEEIRKEYGSLFRVVPHEEILERIETKAGDFVGSVSAQKGVINSALFTEQVAKYLLKEYSSRITISEHTYISKVALHDEYAVLDAGGHEVRARRVVLCTNGFENIRIFNRTGLDIDTRFHHNVYGTIGYMSGYLENLNKSPIAISYFDDPNASHGDPYFYLTRRPYEFEKGKKYNLISVGGPEVRLEDAKVYEREEDYPEHVKDEIDIFVKSVYDTTPNKKIDYIFTWHGLMGYTTSGVRLVGPEPKNPVLLYNLGCNGVGILPSIFGGEKISRIIKGEFFPPAIFDPKLNK